MKKIFVTLLCVVLILPLFGCGKAGGNDLWDEASPGTSAMHFYRFDEEGGYGNITFDQTDEGNILNRLSAVEAVPVTDWTAGQVKLPVYGIEIGSKDGWGIHAAWSDGYLILRDGSVYRFDFDFATLEEDYEWEYSHTPSSLSSMPCGRLLSEGPDGWIANHLSPAEELTAPEGITMTLKEQTADKLTVKLTNHSNADWSYGSGFSLDVLLNGAWYDVPQTADQNWMVTQESWILPAGKTQEKNCSLHSYGTLPEGSYRLVVEGMSVEFTLPFTGQSIVSITDKTGNRALVDILEYFFEDAENQYYFSNPISQYVIVRYADGSQEDIKTALQNGRAAIGDLDRFGIHYWTEPKTDDEITCVLPPDLSEQLDENTLPISISEQDLSTAIICFGTSAN